MYNDERNFGYCIEEESKQLNRKVTNVKGYIEKILPVIENVADNVLGSTEHFEPNLVMENKTETETFIYNV